MFMPIASSEALNAGCLREDRHHQYSLNPESNIWRIWEMTEGPLTALGQLRYISIYALFTAIKRAAMKYRMIQAHVNGQAEERP